MTDDGTLNMLLDNAKLKDFPPDYFNRLLVLSIEAAEIEDPEGFSTRGPCDDSSETDIAQKKLVRLGKESAVRELKNTFLSLFRKGDRHGMNAELSSETLNANMAGAAVTSVMRDIRVKPEGAGGVVEFSEFIQESRNLGPNFDS